MKRLASAIALALLALVAAGIAEEDKGGAGPAALVGQGNAAAEASSAFVSAGQGAGAAEALPAFAFDDRVAGYAGEWVEFEDGFRLYLPAGWAYRELDEAQRQAGLFYRADNGGGDAAASDIAMGVAVGFVEVGDLMTLDDLAADLEAAGATSLRRLALNGIPAVTYVGAGDGYRAAAIFHPEYPAYVLTVYVTPVGAPGTPVGDVGAAILGSLSPLEAE